MADPATTAHMADTFASELDGARVRMWLASGADPSAWRVTPPRAEDLAQLARKAQAVRDYEALLPHLPADHPAVRATGRLRRLAHDTCLLAMVSQGRGDFEVAGRYYRKALGHDLVGARIPGTLPGLHCPAGHRPPGQRSVSGPARHAARRVSRLPHSEMMTPPDSERRLGACKFVPGSNPGRLARPRNILVRRPLTMSPRVQSATARSCQVAVAGADSVGDRRLPPPPPSWRRSGPSGHHGPPPRPGTAPSLPDDGSEWNR